ncbi:hypothetical protein FH608_004035 [Nonomuraea phyllanthi]|uniref:Uncharacterized protein n=1 Tax=Nonomuraea phyllanthi TaxID=2219224 RepID=A0A5C4WY27_9ACTN|nr:hypothetical protein [Nonomuraea phyllanthi]KAB8197706.1 hypothetical protein FH608_004035 [Nonomuraea phyllanthi]
MSSDQGIEIDSARLGEEEFNLGKMGYILGYLNHDYYTARLPANALAPAGEPARWQFNGIEADLEDQLRYAKDHAFDLAGKIGRSKHGYDVAESAAARKVLEAVADARQVGYEPPELDAPQWSMKITERVDGSSGELVPPWQRLPGFGAAGAGALGLAGLGFAKDARLSNLKYELWRQTSYQTLRQPKVSDLSKRTQRNLLLGRRLSWSLIVAGLAWEALVVPSDVDLFESKVKWDVLASDSGSLFGYSAEKVREAIAAAWKEGLAAESADERLVEFMAAGVQFANRVRRLAKALDETLGELERIHIVALAFSGLTLGLLVATTLGGPANPVMQAFRERVGGRLATVIFTALQLAPTAYFVGLAMHRFETANDSMKIGDRTIDGFKPLR